MQDTDEALHCRCEGEVYHVKHGEGKRVQILGSRATLLRPRHPGTKGHYVATAWPGGGEHLKP